MKVCLVIFRLPLHVKTCQTCGSIIHYSLTEPLSFMSTLYASYNERGCSILKRGSRVPVLFSVLQLDNAYRTTCYKSTLRDIMMGIKAL